MKIPIKTLLLVLLALTALPVRAEPPIRLGVLAFRPKDQATKQWQPLAAHIEKSIGRKVELTAYNYPDLNIAVQQKSVDIVLTNPGHYILLKRLHEMSAPLATQITREGYDDVSSFGGLIFTRSDNATINSLTDLAGKRIAATDIDSLGGYLMQAFEMLEANVALPDADRFLPTGMPHDRVEEAVMAGRADVGFVRSGVIESLVREGKIKLSDIKILNRQHIPSFPYLISTRLYPEWPVAVMPQVDANLARRLAVALLSLPSNSAAARAAGLGGFTVPADYSGVEEVLRKLRMPPFDKVPEFTLADLWKKYTDWIVAFLSLLVVIFAAMGARLLIQNRREKQTQQRFVTLFEFSPEPMWIIANGRFTDCNRAALDILGIDDKTGIINRNPADFSTIVQPDQENSHTKTDQLINMAAGGQPQRFEWVLQKPNGIRLNLVLSLTRITLNEQQVVLAVGHDITNRKLAELREHHRNQVLEMLTAKVPLSIVLDTIARDMENINPTLMCCILLLDEDGIHLRHGAAPSFPDFFNQALDGLAIGPGVAACGTAAYTGERVIIEDIETHPYWAPYLALAHRAKLGACWSQPILSAQGKVLGTVAIYHRHAYTPTHNDLQLIEDEALLAALAIDKTIAESRLQLAASVFDHAREGIMITDHNGTIIEINDTFTHITGYSRDEVLNQDQNILKSGQHEPEYFQEIADTINAHGHWSGEMWNRRRNGDMYAEMQTISIVRDSDGKAQNYVTLFTDITPLKEHQQQLEHIAHYDALTNLPNRVMLADRMLQAMVQCQRRNQSLAVVYLDLDGFKSVNDQYGHDVGDTLLIALAARMKTALRDGDTLARIGGDEFVAVLVGLERAQDWEPVLSRLLLAAAKPVSLGNALLQVSASIGVTLYPQDNVDADQLMRHADQAMYIAKQSGKNRYHLFDIDQDAAVQTQRESMERIQLALDQQEFVLYFQPKVNMKTGVVIGAEALIRWIHPERGLLTPIAFLPNVENTPVSLKMGEWIIETALQQLTRWHAAGLKISLSVNITAHQLQQSNFLTRLTSLLQTYPDIHPAYLELEILETSALEDVTRVSSIMHACRDLGVRFALDDFGTGYSSLTYLKRLPADVLKIDQSFVSDMFDNPNDLAIVEGVIGLAAAFHRDVIAEGVETVMHGQLLLSLGCELAQGYGIAWPMPAAEFPAWAHSWRPDVSWTAWRDHPYSREDISVVHAEVEHRHWMYNIDSYLNGKLDMPPPLDIHQCHFGVWLETKGRTRYSDHPYFAVVMDLHERVHAMGHELVDLHTHGQTTAARSRLKNLYHLRDELIAKLRVLASRAELNN